eukprot:TRINITY_DN21286_c0_g2_i7.p1 TRINITY_DN21286_c0_g2~~TRINITY_DN21286_c0_g2_i7.p1  ORF type:complete len:110 (-),score=22.46 TRINITY_DN21286_c0_g2_i7:151-480(-)
MEEGYLSRYATQDRDTHNRPRSDYDIFRPLIGFKQLRLVKKNDRTMCFVEFTNKRDAAAAMDALEGYKMDETDENSPSLQIQFSRAPPKKESSFTSRSYKPERSRLPWL